ncbi:ornithine carbamoyltransferase [Hydrocarboniclastica marina]|uniref:Ornithine carbamoyltransferase n=1 Tax=Hydrocarboniclastica marina TaxID=2259620 RepID=A0A4P7XFB0_9ALTE|nr:ornithine carbamoyltransferase [Hydrocarboniclastica marina]MAL99763.1 ornithine carbamoyltransferase [Alteromonadaceae bacterium]QCF25263.1 ornithine carbamoyltransferase [Hydrocarboniclastica marina]|tara:strand:+ start:1574 stop:2485 length:912 start_codon:yes stop_codon:yes gene_type:complete
MAVRHFLTLADLSPTELSDLLDHAIALKKSHQSGVVRDSLKNRVLAMIFEKSSTRTRVSFEAGMAQLGGSALFLSPRDTQLGRGEPVEDSARVISRMADGVMIRTFEHKIVETFAHYSRVPVINALTDDFHPCQLLADMQTWREHRGSIKGARVAWVGDGNNMCHSYIMAAEQFDFQLAVACPAGYEPDPALLNAHGDRVQVFSNPEEAVSGAHLIATDVWASMGQEDEQGARLKAFAPYQVNPALMQLADKDALFMHCLPAHRGEEISADMLEHRSAVVWDEAENRLHAQKALLEFLLLPGV